jgi:hypothetical protein
MRLHVLTFRRERIIPFLESLVFTPASDNNLTVFKQVRDDSNRTIFGDKIYSYFQYFNVQKRQKQNVEMFTQMTI